MQTTLPGSTEGKWWGHSMTIWGTVITSLATIAPVMGPLIGIEVTSDVVQQVGSEVTTAAQALTALAGTLLTIWGRIRATQPLERRNISIRL